MYSVRQTLKENWKSYLETHKSTSHQKEEVEKMIGCSKNSCNSRICSSCGKRYTDDWSSKLSKFLLPVPHRHFVLTIPSFLRHSLRDWNNIDVLMQSSWNFFSSCT